MLIQQLRVFLFRKNLMLFCSNLLGVKKMIKINFKDEILSEKVGNIPIWKSAKDDEYLKRPDVRATQHRWILINEIHQWFVDYNIEYSMVMIDRFSTTISFQKESNAFLFKLTWL